jgi:hypothetical protein
MQTIKNYFVSSLTNKGINEVEANNLVEQAKTDIEIYLNSSMDKQFSLSKNEIKDVRTILRNIAVLNLRKSIREKPFANLKSKEVTNVLKGLNITVNRKYSKKSVSMLKIFGERHNVLNNKLGLPHKHIMFYSKSNVYIAKHKKLGFKFLD